MPILKSMSVSSTMPRVKVDVSSTLLIFTSMSHPRGQFFEL
jgi:hypothetical protein